METLAQSPENIASLKTIDILLNSISDLSLKLDIWKAQNIYFSIAKNFLNSMNWKAEKKDANADQWVKLFENIGNHLNVRSG